MPPRLVLRVVNRATLAAALGAGEPAPARKIQVQIEPAVLDRKLDARHRPRRLQPKGQLEKIGVSHPCGFRPIAPNANPRNGLTHWIQRGADFVMSTAYLDSDARCVSFRQPGTARD